MLLLEQPASRRAGSGVLAVSTACLLLAACGRGGGASEPKESLTVTVGQTESRAIALDVVASGSVAAWQEVSLGVELNGVRVERVLVEVGAKVRAGQPLLLLDTRSLQVDLRRAEAAYAQARANLDLAVASATRGQTLLQQQLISQSNFDQLRATRSGAEAGLQSAAAERDSAREMQRSVWSRNSRAARSGASWDCSMTISTSTAIFCRTSRCWASWVRRAASLRSWRWRM